MGKNFDDEYDEQETNLFDFYGNVWKMKKTIL